MHHKGPVPRKIHGLFRHDYLAVEVGVEINHRDKLPEYDYARIDAVGRGRDGHDPAPSVP